MSGRRSNRTAEDRRIDDVEELLKATEDELLLDLSVGSHISKVAPSYIDSDLNRRFQALKKPSISSSSPKPITQSTQKPVSDGVKDGGDLLARLAALKGSRHSSAIGIEESDQVGDSDEEDEVEKIIQWAKDAARLDPSPPIDSDDSDNFQPSDIDDDLEEERKSSQKKKQRPKQLLQIAKKRPGQ